MSAIFDTNTLTKEQTFSAIEIASALGEPIEFNRGNDYINIEVDNTVDRILESCSIDYKNDANSDSVNMVYAIVETWIENLVRSDESSKKLASNIEAKEIQTYYLSDYTKSMFQDIKDTVDHLHLKSCYVSLRAGSLILIVDFYKIIEPLRNSLNQFQQYMLIKTIQDFLNGDIDY